jgi:RNase P protein component
MPPKSKRLESKDFTTTNKSALYKTPYFDIKILFNNKSKFACVVKKNIFSKAVLRNKTRRIVYSVLSATFKNTPYSVIAYPRKQVLDTAYKTLIDEAISVKREIKL